MTVHGFVNWGIEGLNRKILISATLTIGALLVIVWLAGRAGLTFESVTAELLDSPEWLVPVIALTIAMQIAISAQKWRLVIERLSPSMRDTGTFGFYFIVSVASAFLSQILTVYLSSLLARSWAAKRFHGVALGKGAGSSLFEQVFDAAIILAFAIPAALALLLGFDTVQWVGVTGLFWTAAFVALVNIDRTTRLVRRQGNGTGKLARTLDSVQEIARSGIFERKFLGHLFLLSSARYVLIAIRAPIVAGATLMIVSISDVFQGFALVQATQLASLTPGNLGIQEWTWTGVLTFQEVSFEAAAAFAISFRIVTFLAMATVTLGVGCFQMFLRKGKV